MAKIRYGPTIADVRGSIGALTYSRNTADHYIASRSPHAAPLTPNAIAARAILAAAAQAWRALTSSQRADWDTLAATPPEIDYDPWAIQKFLTGFAWFVRIYARQASTSETLPTAPPTDAQPTPPTITAAAIAPYGSINAASFITLTSPQPNLIANGGFEPPYTAGLANTWTKDAPADLVCTEETADVYAGASSQKGQVAAVAQTHWIRTPYFPLTTHPGHWFQCATKVLTNYLHRIYVISDGHALQQLYLNLTNPAWLLRYQLFTPNYNASHRLYVITYQSAAQAWLLDAFKLTAPEYFILSAAINPSAGRQTPDHSYRLLHAGYSTTPTTISIGNALANLFGAYPAGWTLFLKLERQSISGLRSTPALFTTVTG